MKHVSIRISDVVKLHITCDDGEKQELILDEDQARRLGRMLISLDEGGFDIL